MASFYFVAFDLALEPFFFLHINDLDRFYCKYSIYYLIPFSSCSCRWFCSFLDRSRSPVGAHLLIIGIKHGSVVCVQVSWTRSCLQLPSFTALACKWATGQEELQFLGPWCSVAASGRALPAASIGETIKIRPRV